MKHLQYHYQSPSGRYLGTSEQLLDMAGQPILTIGATPTAPPPIPEGKVAIFVGSDGKAPVWHKDGAWQVVDDEPDTPEAPDETVDTPPEVPPEQLRESERTSEVLRACHTLAHDWGYDSYQAARTWVGDPNPKFDAEARAIVEFTSACFTLLDDIKTGKIDEPQTTDAFLGLMPAIPTRPFSQ